MDQNWILKQAAIADQSKGFVLLENPEVRSHLDDLLLNRFWPVIQSGLIATNYNYIPQEKPETSFKLSSTLQRSLTFMLFDGKEAFFSGQLNCSAKSWMLESKFFLYLSKQNDPRIIFEIIGNSRFRGHPPSLFVYKDSDHYFQIPFENGSGAGWAAYDYEEIDKRIIETIKVNTELHELSKSWFISEGLFGDFMTTALKIYEAF